METKNCIRCFAVDSVKDNSGLCCSCKGKIKTKLKELKNNGKRKRNSDRYNK